MSTSPILVLGATGKTGSRVAAQLSAAGHDVRPASRSSATRFDWDDPATWDPALAGAGAVYLVPPDPGPDARDLAPFVAAVERSSVERIALLSARGPTQSGDDHLLRVEEAVKAGDRPWTILRPAWFDQNFEVGFFDFTIDEGGVLRLPVGTGREPFIDAEDIAAVAVAALTEPGHEGRTYALSGPEPLTFAEAVATIGAAGGPGLTFADADPEEWAAGRQRQGLPDEAISVLTHLFAAIRAGENATVSPGVEEALGRPPTPFATWARRTFGEIQG